GVGRTRQGVIHGHGRGGDERIQKSEVTEFLNQVDRGIRRVIGGPNEPLVVAAVEWLIPIYREVSEYPHVMPQGVTGAPNDSTPDRLRDEAWPIVEPLFRAARE